MENNKSNCNGNTLSGLTFFLVMLCSAMKRRTISQFYTDQRLIWCHNLNQLKLSALIRLYTKLKLVEELLRCQQSSPTQADLEDPSSIGLHPCKVAVIVLDKMLVRCINKVLSITSKHLHKGLHLRSSTLDYLS